MRKMQCKQAIQAFACAFILAFAVPAWAQKTGIPKLSAGEAKYDDARQAELMKRQVEALAPQTSGVTDIYAIGLAGWATQSVFRDELNGALEITGKMLTITSSIRLINNAQTYDAFPLASRPNFAAAVHAVASVMNKEEDVLFLFLTSHGNRDGIALQLPSGLVPLSPKEVAAVLKKEGIKNRVVIVSSCFSGVYVKPLANENTIVLTAADTKNTSFGCADGRVWTYFGDALFAQSLKPGQDFQAAYTNARALIAAWEKRDRYKPSNPQGSFGKALVEKPAPLFEARATAKAN